MKSKAKTQSSQSRTSVVANEILPSGRFQECSVEEALQNAAKPIPSEENEASNSDVHDSNGKKESKQPHLRSFWIDAEILDANDLQSLPDNVFKAIPPFVKRHLMQASQLTTPQTLVLPESVLTVFPILPAQMDTANITLQCCAIICLENLLISIVSTNPIDCDVDSHDNTDTSESSSVHDSQPLSTMFQRLDMTRKLFYEYQLPGDANTTSTLCALFTAQSNRVSHAVEQLRAQAMKQYKQMQQEPKSISKSDIMDLVDALLQMESVADEQYQVFLVLSKEKDIVGTLDPKTLKPGLKGLLATSSSVKRSVARLENRQMHVYKMYESQQQAHANHRLNVLTIISAIFLPITLLAGIWGMNFINMPELEMENGYYYALATMGSIALVMTFAFWRLGWFNMS